MTDIVTLAHNLINLLVPTVVCGFIVKYLFTFMNWWNPMVSGVLFGAITFCCILPLTLDRLKEARRMEEEYD